MARSKKPFLNRMHSRINSFVEKYIVDVPDEKKAKARKEMRAFAIEAIKAGAEGAGAGLAKGAKS